MIFLYLLLAHLLGDFILQNSKLVNWKNSHFRGLLVHSGIHSALTFFVLLPLLFKEPIKLIVIALVLGTIHLIIDSVKIRYNSEHTERLKPFIFDQLWHLGTLFLLGIFISTQPVFSKANLFFAVYSNPFVVFFPIYLIFATKVLNVARFEKQREKSPESNQLRATPKRKIYILSLIYFLVALLINLQW